MISRYNNKNKLKNAGRVRIVSLACTAVFGSLLLIAAVSAHAGGPRWWIDRGVAITNGTVVTNDFVAANAGQLKWIASKAKDELDYRLFGGSGPAISSFVSGFTFSNNFRAINAGQLKYCTAKYYDRLIQAGYTNAYPWPGTSTNRPNDFAAVNVGQVKYAFSFDLSAWVQGAYTTNGFPQNWLLQYFGNSIMQVDPAYDTDNDGLSALAEFQYGSDPVAWSTSRNGWSDSFQKSHGLPPASRVFIEWGNPIFTPNYGDVCSYVWPAWMKTAYKVSGEWVSPKAPDPMPGPGGGTMSMSTMSLSVSSDSVSVSKPTKPATPEVLAALGDETIYLYPTLGRIARIYRQGNKWMEQDLYTPVAASTISALVTQNPLLLPYANRIQTFSSTSSLSSPQSDLSSLSLDSYSTMSSQSSTSTLSQISPFDGYSWHCLDSDPSGSDELDLQIQPSFLSGVNLVLSAELCRGSNNATLYVDLLNSNSAVLFSSGNIITNAGVFTCLMDVPLSNNPTATFVRLRRGAGEIFVGKTSLYVDMDHDGLDAAQEAALGTSDYSADTDGDGFTDLQELGLGTDPANAASFPATISGTISYAGAVNGPVTVVLEVATNSLQKYTVTIPLPGVYTISNVPTLYNYNLYAYRDLNLNSSNDAWEPYGAASGNPLNLTGNLQNRDITVADQTDTDGDGLPDAWELFYFGSETAADPLADGDYDGWNNLDEYRNGGNPIVDDSGLGRKGSGGGGGGGGGAPGVTLSGMTMSSDGSCRFTIKFPSGVTNRQAVFACDNLMSQVWTFVGITNLSSGATSVDFVDYNAHGSIRFYRTRDPDKDSDGDGIADCMESYIFHTNPNLADTDGDGINDGLEVDRSNIICWGNNSYGQSNVPPSLLFAKVSKISSGANHTMALKSDGTVVCWGSHTSGETNVPASATGIVAVAGGQNYSLALKNNGTVLGWGDNTYGETNVPACATGIVSIAAGNFHCLALRSDKTIVSWGYNSYGQTNVPASATGVVAVAGGLYHSMALKKDGKVICWGSSSYGQTNVPASATGVVAIAAGYYHSMALRNNGTVICWGDGSDGQTNVPASATGVVAIAAGTFHSMALRGDGTVVCWGYGSSGQTNVPVGLTGAVAIAGGYLHSVALVAATPLNPLSSDTDGDGIPDGWEVAHGLNPLVNDASLDPDGDGLTNLQEYQHNTNPWQADSDNDGISDLSEVLMGLDPSVTNSYQYLPFSEDFNLAAPGDVNGWNGWISSVAGLAMVETTNVHGGACALELRPSSTVARAFHPVSSTSIQRVQESFYISPVRWPTGEQPGTPDASRALDWYINNNGLLVVRDGSSWRTLTNSPAIGSTNWIKILTRQDYSNQLWAIWIDGAKYADNLAFANPLKEYCNFSVYGSKYSSVYVDDILAREYSLSDSETNALVDVTNLHVDEMGLGWAKMQWTPSKSPSAIGCKMQVKKQLTKTGDPIFVGDLIDIGGVNSVTLTNEPGYYYTVELHVYDASNMTHTATRTYGQNIDGIVWVKCIWPDSGCLYNPVPVMPSTNNPYTFITNNCTITNPIIARVFASRDVDGVTGFCADDQVWLNVNNGSWFNLVGFGATLVTNLTQYVTNETTIFNFKGVDTCGTTRNSKPATSAYVSDLYVVGIGVNVELVAHRTCGKLGEDVSWSDKATEDPDQLIILVNDDFDENPDGSAKDCADSHMKTEYAPDEPHDDDLVKITLKPASPLQTSGSLSIELSDPSAVHLFKDDGTGDLLSDMSVDLANPSGDLSDLASTNLNIWLEGLHTNVNFVLSYVYRNAIGAEMARDKVHIRIVQFQLKDQSGNPIDDVAKIPKELLLEWGVDNDSDVPVPPLSQFSMEIEALPKSLVVTSTVVSDTVLTDHYDETFDADVSYVRSQYYGTMYSSATTDLVSEVERAAIKANRNANTVHNDNAKVSYTTGKDLLERPILGKNAFVLPLGQSMVSVSNSAYFAIYVPTADGGKLTVGVTGGNFSGELEKGPYRTKYINGSEMPSFQSDRTKPSPHGWYMFKVTGSGYTVTNTFVQVGEAKTVPWNFWFGPFTTVQGNPATSRFFDNPGQYTRFDYHFTNCVTPKQPTCAAFAWEVLHHMEGLNSDAGHCSGGAMASCIMQDPNPALVPGGNLAYLTKSDLKGCLTEFFNSAPGQYSADGKLLLAPYVPCEGHSDGDIDENVHVFHTELIRNLRIKHVPFVLDLRTPAPASSNGPAGWNHAVYQYTSEMWQDPQAIGENVDKRYQIRTKTTFIANSDCDAMDGDPKNNPDTRREQETEYVLTYTGEGAVSKGGAITLATKVMTNRQDWVSMKMTHAGIQVNATPPYDIYVPQNLVRVDGSAYEYWDTGNPVNGLNANSNTNVTYIRLNSLMLQRNVW